MINSLNHLENKKEPSWLWDFDRNRILWANKSGVSFFNESSMPDLVERRFYKNGITVQKIVSIMDSLKEGDSINEVIVFVEAGQIVPCTVTAHKLEDGRIGSLITSDSVVPTSDKTIEPDGELFKLLLTNTPFSVSVISDSGDVIFINNSCGEIFDKDDKLSFSDFIVDKKKAKHFLSTTSMSGYFSDILTVKSKFGERVFRISAAKMNTVDGQTVFMVYFQDIQDRVEYEKENKIALERYKDFAFMNADVLFELDKELKFTYISDNIEELTGYKTTDFIGKTLYTFEVLQGVSIDKDRSLIDELTRRNMIRDFDIVIPNKIEGCQSVHMKLDAKPIHNPDFDGYRSICVVSGEGKKKTLMTG